MLRRAAISLILASLLLSSCRASSQRRVVVGSKNFTEQIVLAELLTQYLRSQTGLTVDQRVNLGGTMICQQAIESGRIDLYVEYTGTALTAVLGEAPLADAAEVYARVKRDYAARFGLEVTEPLGFNNTFAL